MVAVGAVAGCGGSDGDSAKPEQSTSPKAAAPTPTAACDLSGAKVHVTLTEGKKAIVVTFTGQAVPASGSVGYFAEVWDKAGNTGAQLGMKFNDGEPEGYFVFDNGAAKQTNLDGKADVDGSTVTGTFPKSAGPLSDFDIAQWNAGLSINQKDVGTCPSDDYLQPFPS